MKISPNRYNMRESKQFVLREDVVCVSKEFDIFSLAVLEDHRNLMLNYPWRLKEVFQSYFR